MKKMSALVVLAAIALGGLAMAEPVHTLDAGGDAAIPVTGEAVLLATIEMAWLGFEGRATAAIHLSSVMNSALLPDGPGYHSDEAATPTPCQSLFHSWGVCALIDSDCDLGWSAPSANEDMTWGAVKRLY